MLFTHCKLNITNCQRIEKMSSLTLSRPGNNLVSDTGDVLSLVSSNLFLKKLLCSFVGLPVVAVTPATSFSFENTEGNKLEPIV